MCVCTYVQYVNGSAGFGSAFAACLAAVFFLCDFDGAPSANAAGGVAGDGAVGDPGGAAVAGEVKAKGGGGEGDGNIAKEAGGAAGDGAASLPGGAAATGEAKVKGVNRGVGGGGAGDAKEKAGGSGAGAPAPGASSCGTVAATDDGDRVNANIGAVAAEAGACGDDGGGKDIAATLGYAISAAASTPAVLIAREPTAKGVRHAFRMEKINCARLGRRSSEFQRGARRSTVCARGRSFRCAVAPSAWLCRNRKLERSTCVHHAMRALLLLLAVVYATFPNHCLRSSDSSTVTFPR